MIGGGEKLLLSIPDLRAFLFGSWHIDRSVQDRRRSIRGELRGQARFVPEDRCLLYDEQGTLIFGVHRGRAEQSYRFDFPGGNARAYVRFRDGRAFHELDLSHGHAVVSHACDLDLYEGRFIALEPRQWQSTWKVTGPRKDQEIVTLYTRLP